MSIPDWLAERVEGAPEQLRVRMATAIAAVPSDAPLYDRLALAAEQCLMRGCRDAARENALELLAADALLTHACEAAAEAGSETLNAFAARWDAARFDSLGDKPQ